MDCDLHSAADEPPEDSTTFSFHLADLSSDLLKSLKAGPSQRSRLRYTCSDVSPNVTPILPSPDRYLALGTTSGSVHLFQYCSAPPLASPTSSTASLVIDGVLPPSGQRSAEPTPPAHTIHHFLTIIHEDLIGPVAFVAFAPVQLVITRPSEPPERSVANSDDSDHSSSTGSHDCTDHGHTFAGNGTNGGPHRPKPTSPAIHQLHNLVLAIGSAKGSLLIVDINLHSKGNSSTFFKLSYPKGTPKRKWQVIYQNNTFTKDAISLLRWDNASRLFIGDTSGKLFVLHDVEEMKHLMILSTPTLVLNLDVPGVAIHQLDVAEKLLLLSTNEPRTYIFNLDDGKLYPVGKVAKRTKRKDRAHFSGVGALATYRLVELNSFHYEDSDFDSDTSPSPEAQPKAYRLISTDCQFYVTRPKCRLWVVDLEGQVQFTQEFSHLVASSSDAQVHGDPVEIEKILNQPPAGGATEEASPEMADSNFGKLQAMYWRHPHNSSLQVLSYLVTHSDSEQPRLFVIDPNRQMILASSPPLKGAISTIKCIGNDIFVSYQTEPNGSLRLCVFTLILKVHYTDRTSLRTLSTSSLNTEECSVYEDELATSPAKSAAAGSLLNGHSAEQASDSRSRTGSHQEVAVKLSEGDLQLHEAQQLYQYLLRAGTATGDSLLSQCHCGLPLPATFSCGQFDSATLRPLLNAPSVAVVGHLLEIAFASGHWPLYMHLLAEMGESKFYLYFAILLDEPCLVRRHWHRFGGDTASSEALWQDIVEYIGLYILGTTPSEHFTEESIVTGANGIASTADQSHRCMLCRLKAWADNGQWQPIAAWFEGSLLRPCLLYCSTAFVGRLLRQIITKFIEPKATPLTAPRDVPPQLSHHSTYLFSLDFYLQLLHCDVMHQSTNRYTHQVLTRLQKFTAKSSDQLGAKEAKRQQSRPAGTSPQYCGRVVDLKKAKCAFCQRAILPDLASKGHQSRLPRQIKLYRSCEHIFHSTCTLTRRCSICHRRPS